MPIPYTPTLTETSFFTLTRTPTPILTPTATSTFHVREYPNFHIDFRLFLYPHLFEYGHRDGLFDENLHPHVGLDPNFDLDPY